MSGAFSSDAFSSDAFSTDETVQPSAVYVVESQQTPFLVPSTGGRYSVASDSGYYVVAPSAPRNS